MDEKHKKMVTSLMKSGEKILEGLTPDKAELWHMATLAGEEGGEISGVIKKHIIYNTPLDITKLVNEMGDMEFTLEGIRQKTGITREECLDANIRKLVTGPNARYSSGTYDDTQAMNNRHGEASCEQ